VSLWDTARLLAPVKQGFVESHGSRIAWKLYGEGSGVVLFIPTWNIVDSRVVGHQVAFLARHVRVLTYDPRGAGLSDRPSTGYGFEEHSDDARAVLDENNVERAAVVTASRGINPAVLLAARHPERVERLAVIAPYMQLNPPQQDEVRRGRERTAAAWRNDWPGFVRAFMEMVFSEPNSRETIDTLVQIALEASPEVLIQQESELDWELAPPLLGQVRCPTLVIHGTDDRTTPVQIARAVAAAIADARLVLLEGAGHRPDIRDPEQVNRLLSEFLDSYRPDP
jgi:pimeloyl-ACP methyl ester carboxylesterase